MKAKVRPSPDWRYIEGGHELIVGSFRAFVTVCNIAVRENRWQLHVNGCSRGQYPTSFEAKLEGQRRINEQLQALRR